LYSDDDAPVYRKPLATDPSKKTIKPTTVSQTAMLVITAPIPPPAGVIGSTTLSPAEAWDHCRRAAEFLGGPKKREADWEGIPFSSLTTFSFQFLSLTHDFFDLQCWLRNWRRHRKHCPMKSLPDKLFIERSIYRSS
jgi:hypothetical protein